MIGNLYRPGCVYAKETVETFDHDFPSLASGVAIPHGIYDLKKNRVYLTIGTSHDTSAFAVDSSSNGQYSASFSWSWSTECR